MLKWLTYLQKGIASVDKIDLKMFSVWHPYRKVRLNFENFEQGKALLKFRKGSEFSMDKCCFSSDLLLHDWSRKVSDKILYYSGPIFIKLFNKRLKNWVQTHKTSFLPKVFNIFFSRLYHWKFGNLTLENATLCKLMQQQRTISECSDLTAWQLLV